MVGLRRVGSKGWLIQIFLYNELGALAEQGCQ